MKDLYPSRLSEQPAIIERQDPVAWRDWHPQAPLTREQYDSWCRDGFLILEDVFRPDELAVFSEELDSLRHSRHIRSLEECITEPRHNEMRSLFAPHRHSDVYSALMTDARLLEIAEFLLDSPAYIHQARVNFKPRFRGRDFFWHSDFETWHTEDGMPRMRALSMSITLTENTPWNGPLMLIPGSHRHYVSCVGRTPDNHFRNSLKEQVIGTPDEASLARLAGNGLRAATGKPGTITLFDCNTLHGSPSNISPWPRSNIFFVYNSVANQLVEPFAAPGRRPEYIAERTRTKGLEPCRPDYRHLTRPLPSTG